VIGIVETQQLKVARAVRMGEQMRPRSGHQLPSLNMPTPDLPPIDESKSLDKNAPLPEIKKLPIGDGSSGVEGGAGAGAPGHGGSGPGVDGSVSARTYFREHRERMLMRGQAVRNFESAEIAFLASCRLRKHFTQVLAQEAQAAKEQAERANKLKTTDTQPAPALRSKKLAVAAGSTLPDHVRDQLETAENIPLEKDRKFNWLMAALRGNAENGRLSNDDIDALFNKVGLRLGGEQVRLFVEWMSYPEKEAEQDPILHDILFGTQEAIQAAAAAAAAAAAVAAAAEFAAAKAAAEAAAKAAQEAAEAEAGMYVFIYAYIHICI
jgi:hypothetical protein